MMLPEDLLAGLAIMCVVFGIVGLVVSLIAALG